MGRDDLKDDNRSIGGAERAMNAEFLQPIIEKWLSKLTRDQAVAYLNKAGVPTGPVYNADDIFQDPQVKAREMLMKIDDPEVGEFEFCRTPIHLSETPTLPNQPAPNLGSDTASILLDILDYDQDRIKILEKKHVIGVN